MNSANKMTRAQYNTLREYFRYVAIARALGRDWAVMADLGFVIRHDGNWYELSPKGREAMILKDWSES